MSNENNYMNETRESSEHMLQLKEIYYNCTECSSDIEILSLNEKEYTIEFKCIENNHRRILPIKEYINKMKDFNNKKTNNDECNCDNHKNKKYECYCFDCKKHLCKECLKLRNHIGHNKDNIIEIQPNEKELKFVENIITYYENKIDNLEKDMLIKTKELNNKLKENKNKLKERNELKIKENKNKLEKELKLKSDEYSSDLKKI